MSTPSSQPPPGHPGPSDNKPSSSTDATSSTQPAADADKMEVTPAEPPAETWSDLPEELLTASADEIVSRRRLIENDIRVRSQDRHLVFS